MNKGGLKVTEIRGNENIMKIKIGENLGQNQIPVPSS